ncbi:hypothetical protein QYE76_000084 [Lolium multiflorum]|uniref:Retrotransposon Copia-like N-terminal domain-containing protein n=1 Tax=Lolium multiflorum TaxID=4521 RepID=A0AAD8UTT7_LOLMU|nr:hypothetical protein QYE76_000084 [Lolium multiflorum]
MSSPPLTDGTSLSPLALRADRPRRAPRHAGASCRFLRRRNYSKWRIYMRASLGRSGYLGHVDGTVAAAPTDAAWATADYTVLNHLHAAIDEDVADMILAGNQTARQLWLAARDLFTANKANKAIYLDNDFRQLVQGSLSIHEYCRRQKHLADALSDNDSPVSDRALVLNTLRGLGPRFASAATVISMTDPLPTFLRTRAMLLMEEMQQANAAATSANTASSPVPAARFHAPGPGSAAAWTRSRLPVALGKARAAPRMGRIGGRRHPGHPARPRAGPDRPVGLLLPGCWPVARPLLWTGHPGPSAPGLHRHRAVDLADYTRCLPLPPPQQLALQQGGWVMDSGASSHMTNDDGNLTRSSHLRTPHFVTVGDGTTIPITSSGFTSFRTPSGHVFRLNHITCTEFLNKTVDTLLTTHGTALRLTSQPLSGPRLWLLPHTCLIAVLVPYNPKFYTRPMVVLPPTPLFELCCLCYPNIASTAPHKLSARSMACVFLGYPSNHRGYRCLNPVTGRIIVSRHVVFDETVFLFSMQFAIRVTLSAPRGTIYSQDADWVPPPRAMRR